MSTEPKRVELTEAERALWRMDAEASAAAEIATTKPLQRRILILLGALEEATAREAAARREGWDEGFTSGFYDPLAASSAADASESTRRNPYAEEEA